MDASVIGVSGSGKSTLMEAMAGLSTGGKASKSGLLTVRVPDVRVVKLSKTFQPKKTTFAEIRLAEALWATKESSNRRSAAEKYVKSLAGANLLIHVLRDFENPYLSEPADPVRDLRALDSEMLLADLIAAENFFERNKKRPTDPQTSAVMKKALDALEKEQFLCTVDFSDDEIKLIGGFGFATILEQLILVNTSEDASSTEIEDSFRKILYVPLGIEKEIAELDPEEQNEFLAELGFSEPLVDRVCKEAYALMNYISFFTVGEDEVRAWTITSRTAARRAAGKIHSDLEKGFIRAEVVHIDTFMESGSIKACKETGQLRIEGKNYQVQDGDIITVRFNV